MCKRRAKREQNSEEPPLLKKYSKLIWRIPFLIVCLAPFFSSFTNSCLLRCTYYYSTITAAPKRSFPPPSATHSPIPKKSFETSFSDPSQPVVLLADWMRKTRVFPLFSPGRVRAAFYAAIPPLFSQSQCRFLASPLSPPPPSTLYIQMKGSLGATTTPRLLDSDAFKKTLSHPLQRNSHTKGSAPPDLGISRV